VTPLPSGGPIAFGGHVRIVLNATGTNTPSVLFLGNAPTLSTAGGTIAVYSGSIPFAQFMTDYVSWGGAREQIADAFLVGQWPSLTASSPAPIPSNASLAYDGTGNADTDWFLDTTRFLSREVGIDSW